MPTLSLSVIVPVRNMRDLAGSLIDALEPQVSPGEVEVLLVDNGSTDGGPPQSLPPGFRRLSLPRPISSYAARNCGLRAAEGRALAFTDADCRPRGDWIERGMDHLERHPRVAGRVEYEDPRSLVERVDAERFLTQDTFAREGWGATANLFLRRDVVDRCGQFDARLVSGGDLAAGLAASRAGIPIHYAEDLVVRHVCRSSPVAVVRRALRVGIGVGQLTRLGHLSAETAARHSAGRLRSLGRATRRAHRRRRERPAFALAQAALAGVTLAGFVDGLLLRASSEKDDAGGTPTGPGEQPWG